MKKITLLFISLFLINCSSRNDDEVQNFTNNEYFLSKQEYKTNGSVFWTENHEGTCRGLSSLLILPNNKVKTSSYYKANGSANENNCIHDPVTIAELDPINNTINGTKYITLDENNFILFIHYKNEGPDADDPLLEGHKEYDIITYYKRK